MKRKKLRSLKSLKAELDRVFSVYVRRRGAWKNGLNECVSCGARLHWKRLQAGHFVRRQHLATRWNELNCWPQCFACNVWRRGNYAAYADWLLKNHGSQIIAHLTSKSRIAEKFKTSDLEALIEHYQNAIDNLPN